MVNHFDLAVDVFTSWLIEQFEDADLCAILENDPDGIILLDDDFEKVIDVMRRLKLNIHLQ